MGRLISYELRKLLSDRLTAAILAALLLMNGVLLLRSLDEAPVSRQQVRAVYDHYRGESPAQITASLKSWLETYNSLWWVDEAGDFHQPTQSQIQQLLIYSDNIFQEASLVQALLNQVEPLAGYETYLDSVQENADRLTQSSLFLNPNSYSYRNLVKTAEKYRCLHRTTVTAQDSSGVTVPLERHATTVLLLLAMVLIVLNLALSEREAGLLPLLKPTVNGRLKTAAAKLLTLLLLLLVLTLAFYGTGLVISSSMFGFGDLRRSIQSLDGYLTSPWRISAGAYLVLFLHAKFLGLAAARTLFFMICILVRNRATACVLGAGILTGELLLYMGIPCHSWLSPLGQLNLAAALDTKEFFSDYQNLNLLGWPVSTAMCALVFCIGITVFCSFFACRRWCREETVTLVRAKKHHSHRMRISANLFRQECYKLLVTCRGGLLLCLLLAVQLASYSSPKAFETDSEVWYQQYSVVLAGDYSEENRRFLQEEQAFFDSVSAQQEEFYEQAQRREISREYADFLASRISPSMSQQQGFQRANRQYEYLQGQQKAGKRVQYISTTGYDYLLDDRKSDVLDAGKLCFVLSVCFSMYFCLEKASGMELLIRPSPVGKRAVTRKKLLVCSVYLIFAWALCFLPRILVAASIYLPQDLSAPAASLPQFAGAPGCFTILGYFLLLNLARLAAALMAALMIFLICQAMVPIQALFLSLTLLELPVFLNLLGIPGEHGILPLLTSHWLLR